MDCDGITVEVYDGAFGYALLAAQQIAAQIAAIGGPGALVGKANADLSNVEWSAVSQSSLQQLAQALSGFGLIVTPEAG